jgi:hypothetical protein
MLRRRGLYRFSGECIPYADFNGNNENTLDNVSHLIIGTPLSMPLVGETIEFDIYRETNNSGVLFGSTNRSINISIVVNGGIQFRTTAGTFFTVIQKVAFETFARVVCTRTASGFDVSVNGGTPESLTFTVEGNLYLIGCRPPSTVSGFWDWARNVKWGNLADIPNLNTGIDISGNGNNFTPSNIIEIPC